MQLARAGNTTPYDLNSTAYLTIYENQPVGTEVGHFNAVDPRCMGCSFFLITVHLITIYFPSTLMVPH